MIPNWGYGQTFGSTVCHLTDFSLSSVGFRLSPDCTRHKFSGWCPFCPPKSKCAICHVPKNNGEHVATSAYCMVALLHIYSLTQTWRLIPFGSVTPEICLRMLQDDLRKTLDLRIFLLNVFNSWSSDLFSSCAMWYLIILIECVYFCEYKPNYVFRGCFSVWLMTRVPWSRSECRLKTMINGQGRWRQTTASNGKRTARQSVLTHLLLQAHLQQCMKTLLEWRTEVILKLYQHVGLLKRVFYCFVANTVGPTVKSVS